MGFEDVRDVLKSFEGTYIPAEFARREKILREKFEAAEAEKRKKKPKKNLGSLSSMLGMSQSHTEATDGSDGPHTKMLWDEIRERGQKQYMEFDKKIREEGEKFLAERDAEDKRLQEEAMQSMKSGWFNWFSGGGGKSPEEGKN